MKKNLTILVAALLCLTTILGCTKKGNVAGSRPGMTANIGTAPYIATFCLATQSGAQLTINGLSGTTTTPVAPYVTLVIKHWAGATGKYAIDSTGNNYAAYIGGVGAYSLSSGGSIIVTSVTTEQIEGSFSFTCYDGTAATGGVFYARVQPQQ